MTYLEPFRTQSASGINLPMCEHRTRAEYKCIGVPVQLPKTSFIEVTDYRAVDVNTVYCNGLYTAFFSSTSWGSQPSRVVVEYYGQISNDCHLLMHKVEFLGQIIKKDYYF